MRNLYSNSTAPNIWYPEEEEVQRPPADQDIDRNEEEQPPVDDFDDVWIVIFRWSIVYGGGTSAEQWSIVVFIQWNIWLVLGSALSC